MDRELPGEPDWPDPIGPDDVLVLRTGMLRLRDFMIGSGAGSELLKMGIVEFEATNQAPQDENHHLTYGVSGRWRIQWPHSLRSTRWSSGGSSSANGAEGGIK